MADGWGKVLYLFLWVRLEGYTRMYNGKADLMVVQPQQDGDVTIINSAFYWLGCNGIDHDISPTT